MIRGRAMVRAVSLLVFTCSAAATIADERQLALAPPESQAMVVRANCSGCHSVDYILMNSRFLPRTAWEAEVRKMIRIMGAPVSDTDAAVIVDYLTAQYGTP